MGDCDFLKAMGQRILLRRKALKITQEELAERIGVSTQMISNLELGKKAIRPENLAKICGALTISADFILNGANTKTTVDKTAEKLLQLSAKELKIVNDMLDYMADK